MPVSLIRQNGAAAPVRVRDLPRPYWPVAPTTRADGLLSQQVHAVALDWRGELWGATPLGLIHHDGVRVRHFDRRSGLRNHGLRCIAAESGSRTLWIGTDRGVERLGIENGELEPMGHADLGTVDALVPVDNGMILITPTGIVRATLHSRFSEGRTLHRIDTRPLRLPGRGMGGAVAGLRLRDKGTVILGSGAGVTSCRAGAPEWTDVPLAPLGLGRALCGVELDDGRILIGMERGIAALPAQGRPHGLVQTPFAVSALAVSEEAGSTTLWCGDGEGLVTLVLHSDGRAEAQHRLPGLGRLRQILHGPDGTVWCASDSMGLFRIGALRRVCTVETVGGGASVMSVKPDCGLLGSTNGLHRHTLKPEARRSRAHSLRGHTVWDALRRPDGAVVAATSGGLMWAAGDTASPLRVSADSPGLESDCRALLQRPDGLWVGSTAGLFRQGRTGMRAVCRAGTSLGYVYTLADHPADAGAVLAGTLGRGLWSVSGQTCTPVLGGALRADSNVYALAPAGDGAFFAGADGYVVRVEPDGRAQTLCYLGDPVGAWALLRLPDGRLCAGTSRGLLVLDAQSGAVLNRLDMRTHGQGWEFTTSRSLALSPDGTLLCGLASGLGRVSLPALGALTERPVPRLSRLGANVADVRTRDGVHHIEQGAWRLRASVASSWFLDTEACEMRFQMEGFDASPSARQPVGDIEYTALPCGHYRLLVQLVSPSLGAGPMTEIAQLRVTPPR